MSPREAPYVKWHFRAQLWWLGTPSTQRDEMVSEIHTGSCTVQLSYMRKAGTLVL